MGDGMHKIFEDFLVNTLFIIFPLFLFSFCYKEKGQKLNKYVIFIIGAILTILVMTFPINMDKYTFDLRQVPFIIGILYMESPIGIGLFLMSIAFRVLIGGDGVEGALIINIFLVIFLFSIKRSYSKLSLIKKQLVLVGASFLTSFFLITVFYLFYELKMELVVISVLLFFVQSLVLINIVYFIEKIKRNIHHKDEVKRTEKLELISQLAASISHEVRNPLTASRGFLQLLKDSTLMEQKRKFYLNVALTEMDRANNVISDYLSFAKPILQKPEKLNVKEQIIHVLDMIKPIAYKQKISLQIELEKNIFVMGETSKFQQILINLMKNSMEAMPNGGVLSVQMNRCRKRIYINISDTGIGMSQDEVRRLGEPYFSTKDKGTGLGMMVVYSLIRAMKGTINIRSNKGVGTRFSIQLPIMEE